MKLSAGEISKLPTIIDVMETLAERENTRRISHPKELHPWKMLEEGYYMPVSSGSDNKLVQFLPTGPCFDLYYRGQNQFFQKCAPTLYRKKTKEDRMLSRLKANEFQLQVLTHPVVQELMIRGVAINLEALSQHYGFDTNRLDLTNDKWVAAFFATTHFKDSKYQPVGKDFGDGFGVLYASKPDTTPLDSEFSGLMTRLDSIGFQFFPRPTSQSAYGFLINEGENLEDFPFFEKHLFRHDKQASDWVYEISYRQRKYFPKDSLTQLADLISKDKVVSYEAVRRCQQNEYPTMSIDDLTTACMSKGLMIQKESKHTFSDEVKKKDLEEWNNFGKNEFVYKTISTDGIY